MNVRLAARTGHPTKLHGNFTRNVRIRENLPFNVHLLDVVFAAKLAVPGRKKAAYLERHKLLSDDEREALPGDAFDTVAKVPD